MSSTMVVTMPTAPIMATQTPSCCPSCGSTTTITIETTQAELLQAQARITELEAQVRLLNEKAAAAVDKWADYEDELTKLRSQSTSSSPPTPPPPPPPPKTGSISVTASPTRASFLQSGTNRISQLLSLSSRSSSSSHQTLATPRSHPLRSNSVPVPDYNNTSSSPPLPHADLMEAFAREQSLRREAESQLKDTSKEVEELSVTLFEQANNMVADERRARAKLEERVGELERRDREKRTRLEKLETAMARIERVRRVLDGPTAATVTATAAEPIIQIHRPPEDDKRDEGDDEAYENY